MITKELINLLQIWLPAITLAIIAVISVSLYKRFVLHPKEHDISESRWSRQLTLICLILALLIAFLLSLPISETMKGQLLSLLGITLTATIALSSTTFVGNAMAGFMLKAIDAIKPGDFLKVGQHYGRVSEQGLLHTEIQTEDRDLTTLPNLYLVTSPVTVVRSSGTIISATLSLGYDLPRSQIEPLLIQAGKEVGLTEPYVQILELGDFSISYRVAGFLQDVKYLISFRSKLRAKILDILHENKIEIVSPHFMNQRVYPTDKPFIPKDFKTHSLKDESKQPEDIIFDKADEAQSKGKLLIMIQEISEESELLESQLKESPDNNEQQLKLKKLQKRSDYLIKLLQQKEEQANEYETR